jgi:hypothetical protein
MGRFVKDLCLRAGIFWDAVRGVDGSDLCYSSQKREERACKLSVADCDQDVGGAIGDGGVGVPGGLGDLECAGEDGERDGDGTGKPDGGGSAEGEQGGVLLRWDDDGGLQPVAISTGRQWGLLVGAATSGGL